MEEHQNNTDTDVQDKGTGSGEGTAKVIKAGSEAKPGRRVPRSGGNQADGFSDGPTDAARSLVRAGQQTLEADDHGVIEAARNLVRAGQQTLEGAEAATYTAVDESTGGGQVLDEWASFVRRATLRNTQAWGELMHCYTLPSLLQWQTNLLNATVIDVWNTNARILRSVTHRV